jgi:hypothetical protein
MKTLYDSGLHHPFVAYVAGLALLFAIARRLPFLLGFLVVFSVAILADATVTGAWSPLSSESPLYTPLSILFVILGDLRYFLLVERYASPSRPFAAVLSRALAISLLVPVATVLLREIVPAMGSSRVLFLVYELLLFALVLAYSRVRLRPAAAIGEPHRLFLSRVSAFVLVQYAGWAAADVLVLSGAEVGHLLRIAPNVLYYALFLPFVLVTAPDEELRAR